MYGQSNLQANNGQLPSHLLGNSSSNNDQNQSNINTNGLIDANGHLLVEPKQEPEINMQLMQL